MADAAVRNLTADGESTPEAADIPDVSHGTAAEDVRNLTAETQVEDLAEAVAELRRWCTDSNVHVYADDLVNGKGAAHLLGITEGAMRNWRCCYGERIPSVKRGRRVYYRLEDLAAALLGAQA